MICLPEYKDEKAKRNLMALKHVTNCSRKLKKDEYSLQCHGGLFLSSEHSEDSAASQAV
jgi:hypothetical protein